jgi:hypothetical protein
MKKIVLPLAVALILAAAGIYLLRRAPVAPQVTQWLPGGTIFLEEMPDIHRSKERWPRTALWQIIHEPDVQAFLERPLSKTPGRPEIDRRRAQERQIDPTHFFLAVTDWSGDGPPSVIAGFSYDGPKKNVDALLDEIRAAAREHLPPGQSNIETYGKGEIETFTTPNFSAGAAYRGKWFFISDDVALLKQVLDRFEGKQDPDNLAALPAFQNCMQHLPYSPDNIVFVRPSLLADKAASLMLMLNPVADSSSTTDQLKKIDAMAFGLKMDGELMRDAAFVIKQTQGGDAPLANDVLKLSTTNTLLAGGERFMGVQNVQLPDPRQDPSGVLQLIESDLKIFTDKGLGADQLRQAFGPETGFLLDWGQGAIVPTPLAMVDVNDQAEARKFLDTLTTIPLAAGVSFTRQDEGGISYYSLPASGYGLVSVQATLGFTGSQVIAGLSPDDVRQAASRLKSDDPTLAMTGTYEKAMELVDPPTLSFTYIDAKAIFDRTYGPLKTISGLASVAMGPQLSDYVDLSKLPDGDVISRHLSPIVASTLVKDGGVLSESAGPVTLSQATALGGFALGAAAVPLIEQEMKGQPVTIPGFPGFGPATGNPLQSPFANPSGPGISAPPPIAPPTWAPGASPPAASPSGGTP